MQNQRKIAFLTLFVLTVFFLILTMFSLEWFVKMTITIVYFGIAVLIVAFGSGGLSRLAMVLAYILFLIVSIGIEFVLILWAKQSGITDVSWIQNGFILIAVFILIYTHFPARIKQKIDQWLIEKDYITTPQLIQAVTLPNDQDIHRSTYATYKSKRAYKIMKTKPNHIRNADSKQSIVRLGVYTLVFSVGLVLSIVGITEYTGGRFLYSSSYYVMLIGIELAIYGFLVLFSGFKSAFRSAAIGSALLLTASIILDQVFVFYPTELYKFYVLMSVFILSLGLLLVMGIRALLMKNTIAMLIFTRGEIWLGVELLLKETLPIVDYDKMVMVEIVADEKFDLVQLMRLGPSMEVFAHYRKMIFAGLKYDPNNQIIELYFCTPNPDYAKRQLTGYFKRHFHYAFTMTILNDPLAVILERLNPTDLEMIEAMNRHTVMHYEDEDIDPSEIHSIVMFLHFKEASSMTLAKADLEQAGYHTLMMADGRTFSDQPASEFNGWFVISVETESRLGIDRINIVTRQIADVIRPQQGILSYWILGKIKESELNTKPNS